jgi:thioredoxin reductase
VVAPVAADACPPGRYEVVVVGSGPGGLQTAYALDRLGVRCATLSADPAPGGMFRTWPIFQRLLSWSRLDTPVDRTSRAYEWYDHNSLIADEPQHRALVPARMGRDGIVPTRPQMEAGLADFARLTGIAVRYGCEWQSTRREGDELVLQTSDGDYRCSAAVFALGVTDPWRSPIPGIEQVPHYAHCGAAEAYRGRTVVVIGKRNSGFEIADGLVPWASRILLVSPRPVQLEPLVQTSVRARYLQPLEVHAAGGGLYAVDAAVDRIEAAPGGGYRIAARGTTLPGEIALEADAVVAATGFSTPLGDLSQLGVVTVSQGRIPAQTAWWESTSVPGVFFAGNATQGSPGLRKHGMSSTSAAVHGFRYNAAVLARHLAARLGRPLPAATVAGAEVVPLLARALSGSPGLWAQKGYLARVLSLSATEARDEGLQPLAHFMDAGPADGVAVAVETTAEGTIYPAVYLRRQGRLREAELDPHPLHAFDGPPYVQALERLLGGIEWRATA